MQTAITSKRQMYQLLYSGQLGNTIPHYESVAEWERAEPNRHNLTWAIRDLRPMGRFVIGITAEQVIEQATPELYPQGYNIGCDIDNIYHRVANIYLQDQLGGLYVHCSTYPAAMRESLAKGGKHYHRSAANAVLAHFLPFADLEDVNQLREDYPEHVIELTTYARDLGIKPGRKAVIWEVRNY